MSKTKVLFVCLGNICRSPLAEGIFKHKVATQGLDNKMMADSCGTAAYHIGERPDERSMANALKNGVRYEHRGRQLKRQDFYEFDIILAMDSSNLRDAQNLMPSDSEAKLQLMRDFDSDDPGRDVPDPYYGGEDGFQQVFDILDRSVDKLISQIERRSN